MKDNIEFKSVSELYKRIKPALYSKVAELKRTGIEYIKEEDIWNYLMENNWNKRENLSLADMTSDILYLDNNDIISYMMRELENKDREVFTKDSDLL